MRFMSVRPTGDDACAQRLGEACLPLDATCVGFPIHRLDRGQVGPIGHVLQGLLRVTKQRQGDLLGQVQLTFGQDRRCD
ncbi:hypothetical protein DM611_11585 [Stenotrophomonas maltophilia]|nr:hypothetical protein DM611_11585 [Stenotrophomonas maltophilia]